MAALNDSVKWQCWPLGTARDGTGLVALGLGRTELEPELLCTPGPLELGPGTVLSMGLFVVRIKQCSDTRNVSWERHREERG